MFNLLKELWAGHSYGKYTAIAGVFSFARSVLSGPTAFLHWSIYHCHPLGVQIACALFANPNSPDKDGIRPLVKAAGTPHISSTSMVKILLSSGADLHKPSPIRSGQNENKFSPLAAAVFVENFKTATTLLKAGADPGVSVEVSADMASYVVFKAPDPLMKSNVSKIPTVPLNFAAGHKIGRQHQRNPDALEFFSLLMEKSPGPIVARVPVLVKSTPRRQIDIAQFMEDYGIAIPQQYKSSELEVRSPVRGRDFMPVSEKPNTIIREFTLQEWFEYQRLNGNPNTSDVQAILRHHKCPAISSPVRQINLPSELNQGLHF